MIVGVANFGATNVAIGDQRLLRRETAPLADDHEGVVESELSPKSRFCCGRPRESARREFL